MSSLPSTIPGIKLRENGGNNMKLPYMQDLGNTQTAPIAFEGLNQKELINDNEISRWQ